MILRLRIFIVFTSWIFVAGVVINDTPLTGGRPTPTANQGFGSVEVVTAEGHGQIGDVFDVTVTAKQHYGGQTTGQPFIIPGMLFRP